MMLHPVQFIDPVSNNNEEIRKMEKRKRVKREMRKRRSTGSEERGGKRMEEAKETHSGENISSKICIRCQNL